MAHINRKYIDKHWLLFVMRGVLAVIFGCLVLFGGGDNIDEFSGVGHVSNLIAIASVFLLFMGIIDAIGALYSSVKKHGWINSIIDAIIDILAAIALLFFAKDNLVNALIIISIYTLISGIIDVFHGFLSTVDPTDRFIRIMAGIFGCIMGIVILNAGNFEVTTFLRFFGAYMLVVGTTSMIYGIHNRSQKIEDHIARSEARRSTAKAKTKTTSHKKSTSTKSSKTATKKRKK